MNPELFSAVEIRHNMWLLERGKAIKMNDRLLQMNSEDFIDLACHLKWWDKALDALKEVMYYRIERNDFKL